MNFKVESIAIWKNHFEEYWNVYMTGIANRVLLDIRFTTWELVEPIAAGDIINLEELVKKYE